MLSLIHISNGRPRPCETRTIALRDLNSRRALGLAKRRQNLGDDRGRVEPRLGDHLVVAVLVDVAVGQDVYKRQQWTNVYVCLVPTYG